MTPPYFPDDMRSLQQGARKILFITLSNVGDVILTTPVLSLLRGNFPEAEISVLVGPRAMEIFVDSSLVKEVMILDKEASWFDKACLVRDLRRSRFDLVVDLRNTLIPWLLCPWYRTPFLRGRLRKVVAKREQHLECLRLLRSELALDAGLSVPFDFYSERHLKAIRAKLALRNVEPRDLVLLAPGANHSLKRWHVTGFARLAEKLVAEQNKTVLLIGSKTDFPVIDQMIARSTVPLEDFSGQTTLPELAALMSLADLLVTNDSAPMQLAYELGVPVVAIFGPTDERKFGRLNHVSTVIRRNIPCSPCESAQCRNTDYKVCLLDIGADEVYQACLENLGRKELLTHVISEH